MHKNQALGQLSLQLTEWRKTHAAPSPIPSELWVEAARLAAILGVATVAKALRLNPACLKRRLNAPGLPAIPAQPTFVEWLPAFPSNIAECSLQLQSGPSRKIKVDMKGVPAASLVTLLRELLA